MTKWISQFTLSKLTKIQTDYIKEIHVISLTSLKFLSTFSALKTQLPLSHTISSTLHTVSLSHNLFTINSLSRLDFLSEVSSVFLFVSWVSFELDQITMFLKLWFYWVISYWWWFYGVITCYLWVGFGSDCFFFP